MWWRLFGKSEEADFLIDKFFLKKDVAYYRMHGKSMMKMRKRNKKYNDKITKLLNRAYDIRQEEGITENNTLFLRY